MEELYTLERQEAVRRAEYEARHADALRPRQDPAAPPPAPPASARARPPAPSSTMRSPLTEDRSFFGLAADRGDWRAEDMDTVRAGSKRRLSGPSWMVPPQQSHDAQLVQSRSSGHLVDAMRAPHIFHPYHHPNQQSRPHDDSPSPISSDSEPLPHHERAFASQSPPRIFHLAARPQAPVDHSPPALLLCRAYYFRVCIHPVNQPLPWPAPHTQHPLHQPLQGALAHPPSSALPRI